MISNPKILIKTQNVETAKTNTERKKKRNKERERRRRRRRNGDEEPCNDLVFFFKFISLSSLMNTFRIAVVVVVFFVRIVDVAVVLFVVKVRRCKV